MRSNAFARAAIALAVLEAALAVGSWALSSLNPDLGTRSLLGGEGIRWFFGHFAEELAKPPLVWLLLAASAIGSAADSGAWHALATLHSLPARQRVATAFAFAAAIVYAAFIAALTLSPHAVLLSATGRLFPSPFAAALVPMLAFGIAMCSVVFGVASGRYLSAAEVFRSLTVGVERAAPLLAAYILAAQLLASLRYVFALCPSPL